MKYLMQSIRIFIILTVITGVIYPLTITVIGQAVFPEKSEGSMVLANGKVIGSELIGQKSQSLKYFWGRPSAVDYNPVPSGGSNQGPASKALLDAVNVRRDTLIKYHGTQKPIPNDLIFASASGVDPHISPDAALYQVERVAAARNYNPTQKKELYKLIEENTEKPQFGFLGMPRVNVFLLNLAINNIK
jgi:potassium-transporting ATPase KdpC subunit